MARASLASVDKTAEDLKARTKKLVVAVLEFVDPLPTAA
jgi:hypothetical protein